MKKIAHLIALTLTAANSSAAQPAVTKQGEIERLPDSSRPGIAWFVKVADAPLLFTEQIFPRNVAEDAVTPVVHAALASRFRDAPPAVTIVRSVLAVSGAKLACDAVAAVTR